MEKKAFKISLLSFFLIFICCLLLIKPFVGLADNSDYYRVIQPLGLETSEHQRYFHFYNQYKINVMDNDSITTSISNIINPEIENEQKYTSTQFLFIKSAMIINVIVKSILKKNAGIFDIRVLGVVYAIFYALALYLIYYYSGVNKKRNKIVLFFLILFMFCDISYIIYFNSFFGEAAILVSLFMVFGAAAWIIYDKKSSILPFILFYLSAVLFTGAKVANAPIGILIALFGLSFLLLRKDLKSKAVIITFSILLIAFSFNVNTKTPEWMRKVTNYHSLFYGVLKDSPTPEADLREFGIKEEYVVLKDTHGYLDHGKYNIYSDEFQKEVFDKASHMKVLGFYLKHPMRLIEKLKITAESSIMVRPPYLGNYRSEDYPERLKFTNRFSTWSNLRKKFVGSAFFVIVAYFIIFTIGLIYEIILWLKSKDKEGRTLVTILGGGLLYLIAGSQFVIPIVGNGEADLIKHMYLFDICFDSMLIMGLIWILERVKWTKRNIIICSIGIFIICFIPLFTTGNYDTKPLKIGDNITFGSYQEKPISWKVIHYDEDRGYLVWANEILDTYVFDETDESLPGDIENYGSNLWETSDIRLWLNNTKETSGFLYGFKPEELSLIIPSENKNILSAAYLDRKTGGERPSYWSNITSIVDQNYDQAYYMNTYDGAFLLDTQQLRQYAFDNHIPVTKHMYTSDGKKVKMKYWLRTPYYGNSSMVRSVDTDGLVYHKDANLENMGIAPALYIKSDINIVDGKGTLSKPYHIK